MLQRCHPPSLQSLPMEPPAQVTAGQWDCPPWDVTRQGSQQCHSQGVQGSLPSPSTEHWHREGLGCTTETQRSLLGTGGLAWATDPSSPGLQGPALTWPEWVAGCDLWDPSHALTWLLEHEQQCQHSRMSRETLRAKPGEGSCPQADRLWHMSAG